METNAVYYDRGCAGYPEQLMPYSDMPGRLYVKGALPDEGRASVAIVGARLCSDYGRTQAVRYSRILSANGVQVISGLAYGIDACAHEGALLGGGKTFAVLGCGVDICYPRENYPLLRRMLKAGGGVLSEFKPGEKPLAWHFPRRNRLISALADAVLIIEAKEKSGSLITADCALEQGKSIFALPGRVDDPLSLGCNRLISEGAAIAWTPECILEELGITGDAKKEKGRPEDAYGAGTGMVIRLLEKESLSLEMLLLKTGMEWKELSNLLFTLEMDGRISQTVPGFYRIAEH